MLFSETGRPKEAEAAYAAARDIRRQLASEFPARPEFRSDLAGSHNNLGNLLIATGRLQEAEASHNAAREMFQQLVMEFPNQPDLHNDLAGACANIAFLRARQGDQVAARKLLNEARPHNLAALKANPQHPTYRQFYRNHLGLLTTVLAELLETDQAVSTARTRCDLGWDPPADAYDAAAFLCMCIPIVARHTHLDEDKKKEAQALYADEAIKLLRHAVETGFRDAAKLKGDGTFAPLRTREDFQKLLAELETKGKH